MEKSPRVVCLFSPASLLIRIFSKEYFAKKNLNILEKKVGQKTKERQLIQKNDCMGRKKVKDMRHHKKGGASLTKSQILRYKYQLNTSS